MKKIYLLFYAILFSTFANAQYFVDFEEVTSGGYDSEIIELSGIEWDFQQALIGNLSNDWRNGERSARLRGYGETNFTMVQDKPNGIGEVSFFYRRYGSDSQAEYVVEVSADGGATWIEIAPPFTAPDTDDVQFFSATVDEENDARIRIRTTDDAGTSNRRLNIDDITITDFGSVANPSITITSPSNTEVFTPQTSSVDVVFTASNAPSEAEYNASINGTTTEGITSPFTVNTQNGESYTVLIEMLVNGTVEASETVEFSVADVTQVADIQALRADVEANGDGGYYKITGAVTFTHGDNFRNRKWFQDETGPGLMIFDAAEIIPNDEYNFGDQVTGLTGQSNINNGVLQLLPTQNAGEVSGNQEPSIQIVSLDEYSVNFADYESRLIGFENVSFADADGSITFENGQNYDLTNGSATITKRTEFYNVDYIGTVIPQGNLDGVAGIASQFNGEAQIYSRFAEDINTTLNVLSFDANSIKMYPNPVSNGILNIESEANDIVRVEFYNMLGQRVLTSRTSKELNVSNLNSGVYLVKIINNTKSLTKKVVIK